LNAQLAGSGESPPPAIVRHPGNLMLSLIKLYQQRARECFLAVEQTDKPEERELLLKWAQEWRAAAREGLTQSKMTPKKNEVS
jgi:hypothetical protein